MSRQLSLFGDGALAAAGRESKLWSRRRRAGGGAGLRAAVLGSGSGGNSTIVESGEGCLLLRGLGSFARPMAPGVPLAAAGFRIDVFPVSHDAREPVGIVVESGGGYRFGLATDLGCRTPEAWRNLQDLDILVLESNHDLDMLRTGPYPWRLKERVASKRGHLSNEDAAAGIEALLSDRLSWVVLCHLSETNNSPAFAVAAVQPVLDRCRSRAKLLVAEQHRPGPWLEVGG